MRSRGVVAHLTRLSRGFRPLILAASFTSWPDAPSAAPAFQLPTDNHALLEPSGEGRFFAPTPGRTWTAGQFGCVRSDGWQMHEGIDILALKHDRRGEPTDEVRAAAEGEIAYINRKPGLSNYGIYIVVRHRVEGLEVFTLYAHLREAAAELAPGNRVRAGQRLGIMGRTTNTATAIGKDRAHVHFEFDLMLNERFSAWSRQHDPKSRDDHGQWNGRNLLGLDPAELFRAQRARGDRFDLLSFIREQRELCRVLVADNDFPWLRRYPRLIRRDPTAEKEGIVAYEVSLNFNGLPFQCRPRSRSQVRGELATRLLSVDAEEYRRHPCRKLVFQRGQQWVLTAAGQELLSLLTY